MPAQYYKLEPAQFIDGLFLIVMSVHSYKVSEIGLSGYNDEAHGDINKEMFLRLDKLGTWDV